MAIGASSVGMSMAITAAQHSDVVGVLLRAMIRRGRRAAPAGLAEPEAHQCYAVYSGALSPLQHKSLRRLP
jgi:hypothetical protein